MPASTASASRCANDSAAPPPTLGPARVLHELLRGLEEQLNLSPQGFPAFGQPVGLLVLTHRV
jgi:hypothetical protein